MQRILVTGASNTGKTTMAHGLARVSGFPVYCTDTLMHLGWDAQQVMVATWFDVPAPWIIEGFAVVRALRLWFASHPSGTPADAVNWLSRPLEKPTDKQQMAAKGLETVWREILPQLQARGVMILAPR